MAVIRTQRVYDAAGREGATRYLVDRLWPRGVKKEALEGVVWAREAAPSDGLRRWFGHSPEKWEDFRRRYFAELDSKPAAWRPILESLRRGDVVLLYGARDTERNNAVALREYLMSKRGRKR
ncbi:MAG TPA: DUF488 family protein [candidate division Zixibacteria bacterium]|nr:DUF488 family protein [candidate division Zixibacteria bacterium]